MFLFTSLLTGCITMLRVLVLTQSKCKTLQLHHHHRRVPPQIQSTVLTSSSVSNFLIFWGASRTRMVLQTGWQRSPVARVMDLVNSTIHTAIACTFRQASCSRMSFKDEGIGC